MSENNELHWFVNTESRNFYFAFLLCILLLQKCLLPSVEKPSILDKKERLVLLMPFFPLSQWIIWKIEGGQSFTTGGEGKENQHPSDTHPVPHE